MIVVTPSEARPLPEPPDGQTRGGILPPLEPSGDTPRRVRRKKKKKIHDDVSDNPDGDMSPHMSPGEERRNEEPPPYEELNSNALY